MSRVSGERRSGGIGARDGARLVEQFASDGGGSAAIGVHTAMRPDLMPPERIVAVLRLQLDALDREGEPKAPTARG
jgi:hypothetical protein